MSRVSLEKKFDQLQLLRSTGEMNFEKSVMIFLHEIGFFTRGIYLSPSILVSDTFCLVKFGYNVGLVHEI